LQIEDVARKGFAARRTPQQQGQFTVRPRVMGQVVHNHKNIATVIGEILRHRHGGERRDEGQARQILVACLDHDGVLLLNATQN
tara:strand:- start:322 stop:573 length:252 start_codon:yes stop_codon:yes gene_type:complete